MKKTIWEFILKRLKAKNIKNKIYEKINTIFSTSE